MSETDLLALVLRASLFAQAILVTLVAILFCVLFFIIRKVKAFSRVGRDSSNFNDDFWASGNIDDIHEQVAYGAYGDDGLAMVFRAGYHEYQEIRKSDISNTSLVVDGVRAAMEIAIQTETSKLQRLLPSLATAASASPYIGLLGTVWGIITAFRALATASQATIAQVAPGIAEALIATAMGLFAAIPAVIAYNHLAARLENFNVQYENFADAFCNLVRRKL